MSSEPLVMYTVYDHPKDFPDSYVVREWRIHCDRTEMGGVVGTSKSLEGARLLIPPGLACLARDTKDDPVVVESWV